MKDLIKITEKNGQQLVSVRELYEFLGYDKSQWKRWCTKNIINDEFFVEGVDYTRFDIMSNGNETFDIAAKIDMSKELSMLARNEKGKQARKYFIAVEKRATALPAMTEMEMIAKIAQSQVDQQKINKEIEQRIKAIEDKPQVNAPLQQFAIIGHCSNIGKHISLKQAASYGRSCSKMCREMGFIMGSIPDPRFGKVKTYPLEVLEQIIGQ